MGGAVAAAGQTSPEAPASFHESGWCAGKPDPASSAEEHRMMSGGAASSSSLIGDNVLNRSLAQAEPSGMEASAKWAVPLGGKLAAVCAAIMAFETVLVMAGGFGWALTGLLGMSDEWAWGGAAPAFLLALASGIWLLRQAWRAEQEWIDQQFGEADGDPIDASALDHPGTDQRKGV